MIHYTPSACEHELVPILFCFRFFLASDERPALPCEVSRADIGTIAKEWDNRDGDPEMLETTLKALRDADAYDGLYVLDCILCALSEGGTVDQIMAACL
jgi:hypothetical protein